MFTPNTSFAQQFSKHKEVPSLKVDTEQVYLSVSSTSQRSLFICHYDTIALFLPLLASDFFSLARSSELYVTCHASRTLRLHPNIPLCCITQIFKLAGFMLPKSNDCALTAPPKLVLYSFSQKLPSLNLQYNTFSKTHS